MMKYLTALMLALCVSLAGFAAPATAGETHPNEMLWKACAIGLDSLCPILVMDAVGGEPQAQYELAVIMLSKERDKQTATKAVLLIYEAAENGYAPALRLWQRINPKPIDKATDADILIVQLE